MVREEGHCLDAIRLYHPTDIHATLQRTKPKTELKSKELTNFQQEGRGEWGDSVEARVKEDEYAAESGQIKSRVPKSIIEKVHRDSV